MGFCNLGPEPKVAKAVVHRGEEPPLVGSGGSGAVFFSGCTLRCVFCQNHQISQGRLGEFTTPDALAAEFIRLQEKGCVNVNLVTPTPHLPAILQSLAAARGLGLRIPIVYNTGGYESVEVLERLEGVVDVYLPDFKYGTNEAAERFSSAPRYVEHALAAIVEMRRQVGRLEVRDGVAVRGMIVRHLVLPENLARTDRALALLAESVSTDIALSLMAQYQPSFLAARIRGIRRRLRPTEYERAVMTARALGFSEGWFQDLEQIDGRFLPDFDREDPFGS